MMLNLAQTQVRPAPTRRKVKTPIHAQALMVKDLVPGERVTPIHYNTDGTLIEISADAIFGTLTVVSIAPNEGTFVGYDTLRKQITLTFDDCGIPDEKLNWSSTCCTLPWAIAVELLRAHCDATREIPVRGPVVSRQLVGVGEKTIKPSWAP